MSRCYCVGLTGGLASGKSTVAGVFSDLGATIIDTDRIAHALTSPGGDAMPSIRQTFGDAALSPDGGLDRRRMRALVFSDPEARTRLEALLHPLIRIEAARRLVDTDTPYAVLVVPLLAESGDAYATLVDRVLVIDCDPAQQLERAVARDHMDPSLARAMLAAQATREERLAIADDVLDNASDRDALAPRIRELHERYLRLADAAR